MLPLELLPGHAQWGLHLAELIARPVALWVYGGPGCGASSLAALLAARRGGEWLEADEPALALIWLAEHPGGIVAARGPAPEGLDGLPLHLPRVEDNPECIPGILEHLAQEEGLAPPLPSALGALPCPGNLRELRNRVLRWKLLGQLPTREPAGAPAFEAEDLATNLHHLERFLLHRALRRAYGNRVEAAGRLGVSRRQLYLLIARHGDPVRGEGATSEPPLRMRKRRPGQNSSSDGGVR